MTERFPGTNSPEIKKLPHKIATRVLTSIDQLQTLVTLREPRDAGVLFRTDPSPDPAPKIMFHPRTGGNWVKVRFPYGVTGYENDATIIHQYDESGKLVTRTAI